MTATPSNMMPLGTKAPDFCLFDVCSGQEMSLQMLASPIATVVMFLCNHCPYVKHIQTKLVDIVAYYQVKKITFIAISSNDVIAYPEDGPDKMREEALEHHYSFPYLYDETQAVAKAYQAACTPDFFIFDQYLLCVYRGRFDESMPGNPYAVTGKDLCGTLDHILLGQPVDQKQKASIGCNIKWKKL